MHAIETWDLTRAFGDRAAVERLTFTAPRGAVFGFLGPNGAVIADPSFAGLSEPEVGQALMGKQFGLIVLSDRVYQVILGGGWWLLLLLESPSLALIMVAATVAISGRVNDPRTAQQVSAVVVPLLALFIAQLLGIMVLTPLLALIASTALAFLAVLAFVGTILLLFEREHTR